MVPHSGIAERGSVMVDGFGGCYTEVTVPAGKFSEQRCGGPPGLSLCLQKSDSQNNGKNEKGELPVRHTHQGWRRRGSIVGKETGCKGLTEGV